MIPMIGKLHRERDVTVLLHSRSLVNKSVVSILKTHRFARQIAGEELSVTETLPFLEALTALDLGPSQIDLGMLAATYRADDRGLSVAEFTAEAVVGATGANKIDRREPRDVVLYGFGRIEQARRPSAHREVRLRQRPATARHRGARRRRAGPRQACVPAAPRLGPRPVPGHDHGRRGQQQDHRQRQRDHGDLRRRPEPGRLHGVRRPQRHPHRQHRQVARPRGPRQAPATGHRQGRADRAGQGRCAEHRAWRQPRHHQAGRADPVLRLLHHQRDRPAAEGDGRRVRCPARPCGDRPLVHQRPEPAGQLPQGRPSRPFGAAEHGHHRDRRRLRGRQGAARPQGADHRQLDPGAGAGRLDRDPQPAARPGDDPRGGPGSPPRGVTDLAAQAPDRLHHGAGRGLDGLHRLAPLLDHRRRLPPRSTATTRSSTSGTTTSSATPARSSVSSSTSPGWSTRRTRRRASETDRAEKEWGALGRGRPTPVCQADVSGRSASAQWVWKAPGRSVRW